MRATEAEIVALEFRVPGLIVTRFPDVPLGKASLLEKVVVTPLGNTNVCPAVMFRSAKVFVPEMVKVPVAFRLTWPRYV